MESETHLPCSFRDMGLVSLSVGRAGQGASDATKETMLSLELRSWNQVIDRNYYKKSHTVHGSRYCGFLSSEDKIQRCSTSSSLSHKPSLTGEELKLTLGYGYASKPFPIEASSAVSKDLTRVWQDNEKKRQVSVELGLGLTTNCGSKEVMITTQPSVPVLKGGAFCDLEPAECLPTTNVECRGLDDRVPQHHAAFKKLHGHSSKGFDLQLGLSGSCVSLESNCLSADVPLDVQEPTVEASNCAHGPVPVVDEGSTSARLLKSGGRMPSLLPSRLGKGSPNQACVTPVNVGGMSDAGFGQNTGNVSVNAGPADGSIPKVSSHHGGNMCRGVCELGTATSNTSSPGVERSTKTCKFKGCSKGARGASGLCIAHGGGRRCQRLNCNKGAEGCTMFCKAHGGGRRCQSLGCIKSAEGRTDFCIAHGGGRRCTYEDCSKAARGRSGLCIRHGGGKRCQKDGCTRSAEGFSGLCISHGGGRRCQYPDCGKGAQGSTKFCKGHGGGRRCEFEGCTKGAEGSTPFCKGHGGGKRCTFGGGVCTKSVHGGTAFCVAHGGGKRCTIPGCTKSARGRTDFCVKHGGGKRCKFEECNKSAQGSTDYCKAHGGGKRCLWGQGGSVYDGSMLDDASLHGLKASCDKFARGKTGLCSAHNSLLEQYHPFPRSVSSSSLQGSFSDQLESTIRPHAHSDLSEQILEGDDGQSLHAGSQLSNSGKEGSCSWRVPNQKPVNQKPSTLVFKAQAASKRCAAAAADVSWQDTTDGSPAQQLGHGGGQYLAFGLPDQGSHFYREAGCSLYAGSIGHMPGRTGVAHLQDEPRLGKEMAESSSSRVQIKRIRRLDKNSVLDSGAGDHEGRVHGGGHFMAMLARAAPSHDQ